MKIVATTTMASPYTLARYRSFAAQHPDIELILLEYGRVSSEYAWAPSQETVPFRRVVLSDRSIHSQTRLNRNKLIKEALDTLKPDVLIVCGYGVTGMGAALHWARTNTPEVPVVMLSDSTAIDRARSEWKEYLKRRIIGQCGSALVAGSRHRAYMVQLGMPDERIFEGYDVVDNSYFEVKSEKVRADALDQWSRQELPGKFFLTSARFLATDSGIDRPKNLHGLLVAYQRYLDNGPPEPWDLVLLGDGALRSEIESQILDLGLSDHVRLAGFKQYGELPFYYAHASAFILPSTKETWGLVVNEAMASGLPVIVSTHCGCAPDLVMEGVNGLTFDPFDIDALTEAMLKIASNDCDRKAMGLASRKLINHWSTDLFARNLSKAVDMARRVLQPKPGIFDRTLLRALMWY